MAVKVLVSQIARLSRQNVGPVPGPLNAVATFLSWSYFLSILFLFDPLVRIAHLFGQRPLHRTMGLMCRLLHGIVYLTFSRLEIEGENIPDPNEKYLIVINHQSFLEAIFPMSILNALNPAFICKEELGYGLPAISYFLRNGGHTLIDRTDPAQSLMGLAQMGRRLDAKEVSPVFLPEGTRSLDGRLLRFKRAGFVQILDRAPHARILPIIVDGGFSLFPKGFGWVRANTKVKMKILPPVSQDPAVDSSGLCQGLEKLFRRELDAMRQADQASGSSPSPSSSS